MRSLRRHLGWITAAIVLSLLLAMPAGAADITAARVWSSSTHTRAVIEVSGPVDYKLFQLSRPDRVVLDFNDSRLAHGFSAPDRTGLLKDVRTGRHGKHGTRVVLDMTAAAKVRSFLLDPSGGKGYRLVVDLYPQGASAQPAVARKVPNILTGERKVVVAIDPGHGGKDSGARARDGLDEKTVTLAIGRRLAKLINAQRGMSAFLTRTGDYYVPLKKRFEIAREHKADLFISIHANSCPDHCDARGASVWVLSTHGKQSEAGRWLARSENAADLVGGVSLDNKSHTLAAVLLDLSQGASMQAARRVGDDVLHALGRVGPLYKSKVEHANFVVLRSPDVPSILVETAFISNRRDAHLLATPAYRSKLAHAILTGVHRYFETTPPVGTWFAAQRDKRLGLDARRQVAQATAPAPQGAARADAAADADIRDLHRVTRGETLSGIAHEYGVSIDSIKQANRLSSDNLQAGAMLAIPTS